MKDNKDQQIVKELYKKLVAIRDGNEPDVYVMPVVMYNEIMKKIEYLESALKDARKSRDNLKKKWREKK